MSSQYADTATKLYRHCYLILRVLSSKCWKIQQIDSKSRENRHSRSEEFCIKLGPIC